ncbi:MAG: transposase [Myxococcota bacterium]
MLSSTFYQASLLEVDPDEIRLEKDSFERALRGLVPKLVSLDDFREFHPSTMGAGTCCPLVLTAMLLLQFRYNLTDEALIARCIRDLGFRYALGLPRGKHPPGVSSFRRFRSWIRVAKGSEWLFRLSLTLPKDAGLIDDAELQVADSTNTDCRGAICDTYNLIARGIGGVVREVARCKGQKAETLAKTWGLTQYLGRSIKSAVTIDWSDEAERNALLTKEVRDADRLPRLVRRIKLDAAAEEALEFLAKVAHQDVAQLPDGTYKIVRGTASGRIVSSQDPEARHGRKSESQPITGFKTHALATATSLFVTGIDVTDASIHDSKPTPDLIDQATAAGLRPKRLLGDGAYGTGANVRACAGKGVEVLTKQGGATGDGLTKRDFEIDLETMSATCPAGHTSTKYTLVRIRRGGRTPTTPTYSASVQVPDRTVPWMPACGGVREERRNAAEASGAAAHEPRLQRIKRFNATPESKTLLLRRRCAIERLLAPGPDGHAAGPILRPGHGPVPGIHDGRLQPRFITLSAARS